MDNEIELLGKLLVYKKGYSAQFVYETIKKNNLDGLRIFAHLSEDRLESFDFLNEYTFLTHLSIDSMDDHDWDFLHGLTNLKYLGVGTWGDKLIDISKLINLENLSVIWRKKIIGLENCLNLKELFIYQYKEKDLSKLPSLNSLESLRFSASIRDLNGINNFQNLKSLTLEVCRSLRSIYGIDVLKDLEKLSFSMCSKIYDYDALSNLPNLKFLELDDCKTIKSINFLNNLPLLDTIRITGSSNVEDGDLLPTQRIKSAFYKNYKHYNVLWQKR